ncbi:MAG: class II fructose-bisphosphate aldolase [bacterium]|nr:class II fructose-bisphosphate aldolase [bacterium]
MTDVNEAVRKAFEAGLVVPSFNVPYLPMVEPVVRAIEDTDSFGLVATARLEWYKFEAKGVGPVFEEFAKWRRPGCVALHLDHVPVIDEDNQQVDYLGILKEAIDLGYDSVMVDASRLDLEGNIAASRQAAELAHAANIPCEAELGAVLGHEAGPLPPYEELFESGKGFTDVDEATRFVKETACDWLSVAVGSVHGAVSGAARNEKKVAARINIDHLKKLKAATDVPLVLHGGSGVKQDSVVASIKQGIAKINIGMEIRQAYEVPLRETGDVEKAQESVYERTRSQITDFLGLAGTRGRIDPGGSV